MNCFKDEVKEENEISLTALSQKVSRSCPNFPVFTHVVIFCQIVCQWIYKLIERSLSNSFINGILGSDPNCLMFIGMSCFEQPRQPRSLPQAINTDLEII